MSGHVGRADFIERHGLWSDEQRSAAAEVLKQVSSRGLEVVRFSYPDQHGLLRNKTLGIGSVAAALRNGVNFTNAPFVFDTANSIVFNPFVAGGSFGRSEMEGFHDVVYVPDPLTFHVLPWTPGTGWMLGDLYFEHGEPLPYAPRTILRRCLATAREAGWDYLVGLEVEWYLTKLDDPELREEHLGAPGAPADPPRVHPIARGYQYLLESELDAADEIHRVIRRHLVDVGLPPRSIEAEWGPGQQEITFDPLPGMAAADAMTLFRSAVKQICRRHGYHATFMCKPAIRGFFPSGWHLHQSLVASATGENAFLSSDLERPLSKVGAHFVGGLLEHAAAASVFTTPTVNGYRRRKPYSLAPDRATWGIENKGAMIRLQGGPRDPATHLENRVGEPAANPYLYLASQLASGLDGVHRELDPGPPSDVPYTATERPLLPKTLTEAVAALRADVFFADAFGRTFVDYMLKIKDVEAARFREHAEKRGLVDAEASDDVTDWEQREYFHLF